MKLNEYFDGQKHLSLNENQKNEIYRKFLLKSERVPFYQKTFFYIKVSVYSLFFLGLYMISIGNIKNVQAPSTKISNLSTGFFVGKIENALNTVHASPIGKIIETNGIITKGDGSSFNTGFINSGDVVLIGQGSSIKFQVDSGALASISGPAKFSIENGIKDNKDIFVINLIYGSYFEIKSKDKLGTGVVIKTEKFEISQKNLENKMDVKIITKGKTQVIENNGGELILVKKVKNKDVTTSIKTNQKVEVDQDTKAYAEIKQIESDFKDQKVASSFEISGEKISNQVIDGFTGEVKTVIDENSLSELKNILNTTSLNLYSQNLLMSYIRGEDSSLFIIYKNYLDKFQKTYNLFNIDQSDTVKNIFGKTENITIGDVSTVIDDLIKCLDAKLYIPTKYQKTLEQISTQFKTVQKLDKGNLENKSLDFDSIISKFNLDKDTFIIK